jgi:threonylcarbamoyladenosine tRNA methylthiotransferase MtaB
MPKFVITTLGCKVNQYDSEAIARELIAENWSSAGDEGPVELCVINTCTVTGKAAMQSRQAVRKAIREHPQAQIVVTGCYAQTSPAEIQTIHGVDYVLGNAEKDRIPDLVQPGSKAKRKEPVILCEAIAGQRRLEPSPGAVAVNRTRPLLKIQDGCNAFCTYCIVPHARGRSRSLPIGEVLANMRLLAEAGFQEVVLTGVHLGSYGLDLSPKVNLNALLAHINDEQPVSRVRLSSLEPLELSEEIIQTVAASRTICRHFHIPLQSGDDHILRRMNRPYSSTYVSKLVETIVYRIPNAAIGFDTLIGFPGESEEAFAHTYGLVAELPVAYLHVFPFSPRPETAAAAFDDQVPSPLVQKRCRRMRRLSQAKRQSFYARFVGRQLEVLVETNRDRDSSMLKGLSSNYIPVLFEGADNLQNRIIGVTVEGVGDNGQPFGSISPKTSPVPS